MTDTPPGWAAHVDAVAAGRFLLPVNYHNTVASARDRLRRQLERHASQAVGIDLADLDAFHESGRWPDDRPRWMPVFYEGYANHVTVAAPVLAEFGLVGWFAVCTGFVTCPAAEQEVFARSHFIAVAAEEQDGRRLAATPDELADLATRHVVFPHTASHDGIAETASDADLVREVDRPWADLSRWTGGRAAPVFAWMGGSPLGASARHDHAVTRTGYRYLIGNTAVQRVASSPRS